MIAPAGEFPHDAGPRFEPPNLASTGPSPSPPLEERAGERRPRRPIHPRGLWGYIPMIW